jgi:hypothetical protein
MDKMIFQFNRVGFCEDIHTKRRRAVLISYHGKNDADISRELKVDYKTVRGCLKFKKFLQLDNGQC